VVVVGGLTFFFFSEEAINFGSMCLEPVGTGQGEGTDFNHIHSPSGFIITYQQKNRK
jgi:hypothetical protein